MAEQQPGGATSLRDADASPACQPQPDAAIEEPDGNIEQRRNDLTASSSVRKGQDEAAKKPCADREADLPADPAHRAVELRRRRLAAALDQALQVGDGFCDPDPNPDPDPVAD
jgi:hypothetical protein